MARGRFISESVAKDMRLNSLSVEAELVYLMTIPHLDRDGLIEGDPEILLGTVCPKRRQFLDRLESMINEWVTVGLVVAYDSPDGPVLWFRGFTKNQQGLRYDRETPSKFPAPPGYQHTKTGMERTSDDDTPRNADSIRQNGGGLRQNALQVQGQVEVKDQVEVKAEAEGAARLAAALDRDVARVWEAWDANMPGVKSQVITEGVTSLLEDYSPAEIVEAISIACRKNKRSLSYIQGILAKGAFNEAPKPSGGDYRPSNAASNREAVHTFFAKARAGQGVNGHG